MASNAPVDPETVEKLRQDLDRAILLFLSETTRWPVEHPGVGQLAEMRAHLRPGMVFEELRSALRSWCRLQVNTPRGEDWSWQEGLAPDVVRDVYWRDRVYENNVLSALSNISLYYKYRATPHRVLRTRKELEKRTEQGIEYAVVRSLPLWRRLLLRWMDRAKYHRAIRGRLD